APPNSDTGMLQGALSKNGAQVTVTEPLHTPSLLSELGQYDAFILDNVAAADLSLDQLAGLQEAARTLGRGLIVVGGTSSYGPGGYAGTKLEDALPVTVKVTDGRQRQKVALLVILDKSGSMSYDPLGGAGKIEMAKEAARLAADSLSIGDEFGVLAFNDQQEWVVPMTSINSEATRQDIERRIAGISADGGTEILPALSAGLDAIRNVDADVRHIVLMSDGKARTGTRESYQKLLDDAATDHATLSTIAIGQDADTDLLNFLADQGGGRYHFTEKPEDIPQLTLQEAESAGSQSIIRGDFQPIQTAPSPIMTGFTPQDLPHLDGYDYAEAKPDAQVILTSGRGDPILAKWQYGLGRVVAWTADDGIDFAAQWATWSRYGEFWSSMLRWALPDPENRPLTVGVDRDGPQAVITVTEAGSSAGSEFSGLSTMTATIVAPNGAKLPAQTLAQTGPGQYQLRVDAPQSGAYRIDVTQTDGDHTRTETAGFAVPPSPELQPAPGGADLLRTIAARTGGRVLSLDDASGVFAGGLPGSPLRDYRPVWPAPLALALLALLAEIALRMGLPLGLANRLPRRAHPPLA
ncbi:MAG TPA: glutamine amidotransferase, partial [Thermomicrobiales bacterium]|nr:glutamine amidotransferase [Thermomicrobiales bacterium]